MIKPLVAGNWKMNGLAASLTEIDLVREAQRGAVDEACDILICPPFTLISDAAQRCADSAIGIGGQDCHARRAGAHTGDISAEMLVEAGATHVIVGHSERRADHGEGDDVVREKAEAAIAAGLSPIICVGESAAQRQAGQAQTVVDEQLLGSMPRTNTDAIVVAYEPVWAIGTGLTASAEDIAQMHRHIRGHVSRTTRILYGGSVKPANAAEILAIDDVNGALVGGASLKAADFLDIIKAA
ncbi:MAG: triose-phosphate isomerase [Pseudomonadota bacterium]